jgi:DinB superfamily
MPDLSANRNCILEQLKQAEDAAERLLNGKSREQVNWQPNQGTPWSMWQCFDHLARINRIYCQALLAAVENPRETRESTPPMVVPGWFARWFIKSMEPPVRMRFKAVAKVIPTEGGTLRKPCELSWNPMRRCGASWNSGIETSIGSVSRTRSYHCSLYRRHRAYGYQCA